MRKYEILRKDVEIKFADRKNINCGCAVGALDVVPETKNHLTLWKTQKKSFQNIIHAFGN